MTSVLNNDEPLFNKRQVSILEGGRYQGVMATAIPYQSVLKHRQKPKVNFTCPSSKYDIDNQSTLNAMP